MQFGDAFDQAGFVQLVWNLINNNRITPFTDFFDRCFAANHQVTASGAVCLPYSLATNDNAASREIWSGNILHQLLDTDFINIVIAVDEHIESIN